MTTITLVTNDQALSVVMKPLVASGDYNLVKVQVEFDSAWERYPVRSAVFRTQKGAEAEILLTDNECIIPHEVLAEPGTLFIAMRGVTYSGNVIKTTEEVKYKVVQGAKDIASTTAPSHDMFAQYMAAIVAGIAPHITDLENKIETKYNASLGSFLRIETGSYIGTGTYGVDNPTVIDFKDVTPMIVFVFRSTYYPAHVVDKTDTNGILESARLTYGTFQTFFAGGTSVYSPVKAESTYTSIIAGHNMLTFSEKRLSFYNNCNPFNYNGTQRTATDESCASAQLNVLNATYYYIAIGV